MPAMGLKKCPVCGEKYADTYKRCPFCEEEADPRRARQPKRYEAGGRRLARRTYEEETPRPLYGEEDEPSYEGRRARREDYDSEEEYVPRRRSRREEEYEDDGYDDYKEYDDYEDDDRGSPWFKIVMVILIAIIIACLLYLGRGVIGSLINHDPVNPAPSSSMNSDNAPEDPDQNDITDPNAGTKPTVDDNPDDTPNDDTNTPDDATQPGDNTTSAAGTLTLSHEDVSLSGDESFTLSARSGSGTTTYTSKDPSIASVSASGVVTGLKKGTTEITVQRGGARAVCIVRVKSDGKGTASSSGGAASGKLSSEDFTLKVGESYTLKAQGVTTAITWSVADSSVATVNGSGKVTGVKAGTTTVTASWDGQKATCIVRVKN